MIIDGVIKVMVTQVKGRSVFLGIEAPREISIVREELLKREQKASA